jgi:hypothetical protein
MAVARRLLRSPGATAPTTPRNRSAMQGSHADISRASTPSRPNAATLREHQGRRRPLPHGPAMRTGRYSTESRSSSACSFCGVFSWLRSHLGAFRRVLMGLLANLVTLGWVRTRPSSGGLCRVIARAGSGARGRIVPWATPGTLRRVFTHRHVNSSRLPNCDTESRTESPSERLFACPAERRRIGRCGDSRLASRSRGQAMPRRHETDDDPRRQRCHRNTGRATGSRQTRSRARLSRHRP